MVTKLTEATVSTIKEDAQKKEALSADNEKQSPRLPHERDESIDSQESEPRKIMKQAYDDIQEGQVDTDRRGIPGVEEVERKRPGNLQEEIPASSRMPPSIPKK